MRSRKWFTRLFAIVTAGVLAAPMASLQAVVAGSVSGYVLNAAGRPLANLEVELFEAAGGQPVGRRLYAATTSLRGAWAFSGVAPGDYVVRLSVGRQQIGAPVSFERGQGVEGVTLVAPSTAALQTEAAGAAAAAASGGSTAAYVAAVVAAVAGAAVATLATDRIIKDAS